MVTGRAEVAAEPLVGAGAWLQPLVGRWCPAVPTFTVAGAEAARGRDQLSLEGLSGGTGLAGPPGSQRADGRAAVYTKHARPRQAFDPREEPPQGLQRSGGRTVSRLL